MFTGELKLLKKNPFKYFVIDDFLPKEEYKEIKELLINKLKDVNFETQDNLYQTLGGGNLKNKGEYSSKFNDSFENLKKIFEKETKINNFLNYINSNNFINFLKDKKITNKNFKIVDPYHKMNLYEYFFSTPVYISLKLSKYGTGSFINLHRDNRQKLFAFLFYFGFTDNITRHSGGTQICKMKNEKIDDHETIDSKNYELVYDIIPLDNRFAGFEISNNSWHCVLPIEKLPQNVERLNLQINLMRCNYYSIGLKVFKKIFSKFL